MSISNVMKYAQYVLVEYLTNAISSEITEKLGFRDIANYIRSYEKYRHEYDMGDDRRFVRMLCNLGTDIVVADLMGLETRKIKNARIYLPNLDHADKLTLRYHCSLQTLIDDYSWYIHYIPQILGKCLYWITFGEGKPLHELDYNIGINMNDYKKMGLG